MIYFEGIPYLNLRVEGADSMPDECAEALGISEGVRGRACILQLDDGFPKIDLTEFEDLDQRDPLSNSDLGVVRICFVSAPQPCHERMADVATCIDPDGMLIELLQVYLDKWPAIPGMNA